MRKRAIVFSFYQQKRRLSFSACNSPIPCSQSTGSPAHRCGFWGFDFDPVMIDRSLLPVRDRVPSVVPSLGNMIWEKCCKQISESRGRREWEKQTDIQTSDRPMVCVCLWVCLWGIWQAGKKFNDKRRKRHESVNRSNHFLFFSDSRFSLRKERNVIKSYLLQKTGDSIDVMIRPGHLTQSFTGDDKVVEGFFDQLGCQVDLLIRI